MAWNALWTILGVMLVFLALGVPISYSIGISSLAAILATVSADAAVVTAAQRIFVGMSRFSLTAIPVFYPGRDLMNQGGIAGRLVDLVLAVLGRLPGSLLVANVGATPCSGLFPGLRRQPLPPWGAWCGTEKRSRAMIRLSARRPTGRLRRRDF